MRIRIANILSQMGGLSLTRRQFLMHIIQLFLSMPGRITCLSLSRYGAYDEKTYRRQFEQSFDWFAFNTHAVRQATSSHRMIASDASFVPKSGTRTPHLGQFWNGCASRKERGIELHELAVVDIDRHTALHLEARHTPATLPDEMTRYRWYLQHIIERHHELEALASYLVYDGAAANTPFIDGLREQTTLHLVSHLRSDANLRYLHDGPRRGMTGRPKTYAGNMDCQHPDMTHVSAWYDTEEVDVFTALVNSPSLKRNIRIAYVRHKQTSRYVILFSTDIELSGELIDRYYSARFQIEFLFRDAKQYTGLTHCQARSQNKISFHWNTSLTAVSLARLDWYADATHLGQPCSIADYKTLSFNRLYLERFCDKFGLDRTCKKISDVYHDLLHFGRKVA